MSQTLPSTGLALDARNLEALRAQAKQNPEQALKGVAQQFEAVFLHQLLKSMREATPSGGLMDSDQTRSYVGMLDQQMAQSLSSKGIGLADAMFRQLSRNQAAAIGVDPQAPEWEPMPFPQVPGPKSPVSLFPSDLKANPAAPAAPAAAAQPPRLAAAEPTEDFLSRMKDHAVQAGQALGIPAKFLLGQAALESGWGKREIRGADGSQSHNLFGIKAGASWKGSSVEVMTTEFVDGVAQKVKQKFRAYSSYAESFQDYGRLIQGNQRYAQVLGQTDSAAFAQGLQRAGYATDPKYADKLTRILNGARMQSVVA